LFYKDIYQSKVRGFLLSATYKEDKMEHQMMPSTNLKEIKSELTAEGMISYNCLSSLQLL
jgi:hypothetical protein